MYHFKTTTGLGPETVDVTFEFDEMSNITYDIEIKWQGKECSGLLSEEVNNEIEMECCEYYRKQLAVEIANFNLDMGQKLAEDRQWANQHEGAFA